MLKVEIVPIKDIIPYERNAKVHTEEQIEKIMKSIERFGMNDPIGIWHGVVVEGHGRLEACKCLKMDKVPVVILDHMTDEERLAYMNVHNKLTLDTGYNLEILEQALDKIETVDMGEYGFDSLEKMEDSLTDFFRNEMEKIDEDVVDAVGERVRFTIVVSEDGKEDIIFFLDECEVNYEVK